MKKGKETELDPKLMAETMNELVKRTNLKIENFNKCYTLLLLGRDPYEHAMPSTIKRLEELGVPKNLVYSKGFKNS